MKQPKINCAEIFGVRPLSPFIFHIATTGERPIRFLVEGLPDGLTVNEDTGLITGVISTVGDYKVTLCAKNTYGENRKNLCINVGDNIALTPPMGWSSWNCWGKEISQDKVLAAAKAMVELGLNNYGWSYINIDDGWQGKRDPISGVLMPNEKFPNMKELCDEIHKLGLRIGIYSTPWKVSYAGYVGGSADYEDGTCDEALKEEKFGRYSFHSQDVAKWVEWGMDYLKYDWYLIDIEHTKIMWDELKNSGRDIVLSLSNSTPYELAGELSKISNCWRTTGDIYDSWDVTGEPYENPVKDIGFTQDKWSEYAGHGHWNDADMLAVGSVGWGAEHHLTRLTENEQYSHISLWCLLASPLLIGCDLSVMDELTLKLLTNEEVIAINQDKLGKQARRIYHDELTEIWAKALSDGSTAVGMFNVGSEDRDIKIEFKQFGFKKSCEIRDLWDKESLGNFNDNYAASVCSHGVKLIKIS